jgi:hypothetical protein
MNNYKQKYFKYKLKYAKLTEMLKDMHGNGVVVCENIMLLNGFNQTDIDDVKNKLGNPLYERLCNIIRNRELFIPILKEHINENNKTPNFKNRFEKYITLIENNIDLLYAYNFSNTKYSVDEILKYKDFSPNFILNILNFTESQKQRLDRLLKENVIPVLSYHIVNNNKTDQGEKDIINISKTNLREALKIAQVIS